MYKALAVINLPPNNRKEPGAKITKKELEDAGQTENDIKALLKQKAIGSMDDPIHKDYEIIATDDPLDDGKTHIHASEDGKVGESN
jgi:hypothetical protein